ncbi:hypothetical protein ACFRCR_12330 [Oerskovia sp. NPDC056781]|uniref:hypothetical protein n=1 Tax=Oerskovia sp. NPDC056781 TaxID=3345942 RepID=UPI00366C263F
MRTARGERDATTEPSVAHAVPSDAVPSDVAPDVAPDAVQAPARPRLRIPRLPATLPGRRRPDAAPGEAATSDPTADPAADPAPDDAADAPPSGREGAESRPRLDVLVTGWVGRALDAYPRPVLPLTDHWDASVAGLVRQVPLVPRFATRPLELLDRFGAVHVGPREVGFDGDAIVWERVLEVRTQPAWSSLSADALEANFAQYLRVIPRVPGRGWVLGKVSELLVSLYLSVVPLPDDAAHLLESGGTTGDAPDRDAESKAAPFTRRTVTEILYKRRIGEGERQASTTSVLLQLAFPGSTDAMLALAAERGVPVVHVPVDEGEMGATIKRAAAWRSTALGLRDRFTRDTGPTA